MLVLNRNLLYTHVRFISFEFLKEISQHHPVVMFTKGTTAALFVIAVVSSLVVLSGFIESAYAAKKVKQHNYGMTLPVPFSGLPSLLDKTILSLKHHIVLVVVVVIQAGLFIFLSIPTEEMYAWREICNT